MLNKIAQLASSGSLEIAVGALLAGGVAYVFHKVKKSSERIDQTMSREEVGNLIDLKVAPIKNEQANLNKDIKELSTKLDKNQDRVESKLDRIIDRLLD